MCQVRMIPACMHQNVVGMSPTLVFDLVYSLKAKQTSKTKRGYAALTPGGQSFIQFK
jgi:hypothetical protein